MTLSRRLIFTVMAIVVAMGAVYFAFDPAEARWMPKCMLHVLTGLDCPGCGSQRALHALLHGDLGAAWRANAMLLLLIPYLLLLLVAELIRDRRPRLFRTLYSQTSVIVVVTLIVAWGIIRNFI